MTFDEEKHAPEAQARSMSTKRLKNLNIAKLSSKFLKNCHCIVNFANGSHIIK